MLRTDRLCGGCILRKVVEEDGFRFERYEKRTGRF